MWPPAKWATTSGCPYGRMVDYDILIVGAGPAGLSAAWYLSEKGVDVTLFEAMEKAGLVSPMNGAGGREVLAPNRSE